MQTFDQMEKNWEREQRKIASLLKSFFYDLRNHWSMSGLSVPSALHKKITDLRKYEIGSLLVT